MNAPQTIPAPSALDRELDQIEALKGALDSRAHWLRQKRAVEGETSDQGRRLWCRYSELAEREQVEVLRAAYDLWPCDYIWDSYTDAANETGLEEYPDRAAIVSARRAAMLTARTEPMPATSAAWHSLDVGRP